jgi:hypothetical protein
VLRNSSAQPNAIFVPRRTIQIGIDALVIRRSSQTFDEAIQRNR